MLICPLRSVLASMALGPVPLRVTPGMAMPVRASTNWSLMPACVGFNGGWAAAGRAHCAQRERGHVGIAGPGAVRVLRAGKVAVHRCRDGRVAAGVGLHGLE